MQSLAPSGTNEGIYKITATTFGNREFSGGGGGGGTWGSITGTLSAQTDLWSSLSGKFKLDQTTPQTVTGGIPIFSTGINFTTGAYSHIIKSSIAEGLTGADLRIGLDETNRTLVIGDRLDIDADKGLTAFSHPTVAIFDASGITRLLLEGEGIVAYTGGALKLQGEYGVQIRGRSTDLAAVNWCTIDSAANVELTDTDGRQAWLYIEPKVNQTGTAAFDGIYLNATLTSVGDGTTGGGNNLINLAVSGTSKFYVSTSGNVFPAGEIYLAASQGISTLALGGTLLLQSRNMNAATGATAIRMASGTHSPSSGTSIGVDVTPTINQTDTAATTVLRVSPYLQATGSGDKYLLDLGTNSAGSGGGTHTTQFQVNTVGNITRMGGIITLPTNYGFLLGNQSFTGTSAQTAVNYASTSTMTASTYAHFKLTPTYNQATGDAANTDFLINRTQTAVGSGAQLLIDAQVGSVSKFSVTNAGVVTSAGAVTSTQYKLSALNTAPSSAADTGTLGEIRIAADYIYVCTATDTWVRAAIATW